MKHTHLKNYFAYILIAVIAIGAIVIIANSESIGKAFFKPKCPSAFQPICKGGSIQSSYTAQGCLQLKCVMPAPVVLPKNVTNVTAPKVTNITTSTNSTANKTR